MENVEVISAVVSCDDVLDLENFPEKNRERASRRKKTFVKSKNRFSKIYKGGFTPFPSAEPVIRGMLRKTNVIKVYNEKDRTKFKTNIGNIRRRIKANDELFSYFAEGDLMECDN